ncbi:MULTISPECIES: hypothetical protein [Pseudomonas]|nr:hypothetical protein [Pseudomonas monteilii]
MLEYTASGLGTGQRCAGKNSLNVGSMELTDCASVVVAATQRR